MVKKTGCGLFVEKFYDDTWHNNEPVIWCHCPKTKAEFKACKHKVAYHERFSHCKLTEDSEVYDYNKSLEKIHNDRQKEATQAWNAFVEKHGEKFRRCSYLEYFWEEKRIRMRSNKIAKTCMNCDYCVLIKNDEESMVDSKVVCDAKVNIKYIKDDLYGWQEEISERRAILLQMSDRWHTEAMCERFIKNEKKERFDRRVDEQVKLFHGIDWGSIRDLFLIPYREDFFEGLGWLDGDISVERSEPYISYMRKKRDPKLTLMRKLEKEAKAEKRRDNARSKIRKLLRYELKETDSLAFLESREKKKTLLSINFPDIYDEESIVYEQEKKDEQARRSQLTLF